MIFDRSDRLTGAAAAALLGAALLAAPGAAVAQQAAPMTQATPPSTAAPSGGPAAAKAPRHRSRHDVEAQIKTLHAQLKITPDENAEWMAVADAMRDNAKSIDTLVQQRRQDRASMTALDDLKSYGTIADAHAEGLRKLEPAFAALYAKMTPDQQKNADAVFAHRPGKKTRAKG